MASAAEDAGVHAVYTTDHPAPDAAFMGSGGHHALDPFVALTVAATATSRVRLHTNLVILAYRNPFISAKALATLDVVSGGRLIVGTGAGYLAAEFAAVGADFEHRNDVTDEAIAVLKAVWSGEPITMEGRYFQAADTVALPLPVQRPHPPIWIGGNSRRAMRRAVELADGWNPMPTPARASSRVRTPPIESLDDLAGRIDELHAASEKAGRDVPPEVIFTPIGLDMRRRELPSAQAFLDDFAAHAEIGVSGLTINLIGSTRAEWIDNVRWFGSEVVARL